MKRVGIYSGTFDPVHNGHIAFAEAAIKQCRLDKVFLLVEPRPRRKQGVKAFEHRLKMAELAVSEKSKLGVIHLEQARFTLRETLPVLHARFEDAELVMLIGDDMLDHIAEWPDVDELIGSVQFVIAARTRTVNEVKQVTRLLVETKGIKLHYEVFVPPKTEHSSTNIKTALHDGTYKTGLDAKVYEYLLDKGLYSSDATQL